MRHFILKILKYETSYNFREKKAEQNMDKIYKIMKAVDKVQNCYLMIHSAWTRAHLLKMEEKLETEEKI